MQWAGNKEQYGKRSARHEDLHSPTSLFATLLLSSYPYSSLPLIKHSNDPPFISSIHWWYRPFIPLWLVSIQACFNWLSLSLPLSLIKLILFAQSASFLSPSFDFIFRLINKDETAMVIQSFVRSVIQYSLITVCDHLPFLTICHSVTSLSLPLFDLFCCALFTPCCWFALLTTDQVCEKTSWLTVVAFHFSLSSLWLLFLELLHPSQWVSLFSWPLFGRSWSFSLLSFVPLLWPAFRFNCYNNHVDAAIWVAASQGQAYQEHKIRERHTL